MPSTGFYDRLALPVNSSSLLLSLIDTPLSSAVELPWQARPISPPAPARARLSAVPGIFGWAASSRTRHWTVVQTVLSLVRSEEHTSDLQSLMRKSHAVIRLYHKQMCTRVTLRPSCT